MTAFFFINMPAGLILNQTLPGCIKVSLELTRGALVEALEQFKDPMLTLTLTLPP